MNGIVSDVAGGVDLANTFGKITCNYGNTNKSNNNSNSNRSMPSSGMN